MKFLNTSGLNYHLEELIKNARDRLVLISPFLKLNDRIKELLSDKNRMKLDVRIVYGKSELAPNEIEWLRGMTFVRTSFCRNLHAKCYMNEELCIITSLNLYEFSMVNNNEMGVLIDRSADGAVYRDAYEEAQRIVWISEEIRISLERVECPEPEVVSMPVGVAPPVVLATAGVVEKKDAAVASSYETLTTVKLAAKHGMPTQQMYDWLVAGGFVERKGDNFLLLTRGSQWAVNGFPVNSMAGIFYGRNRYPYRRLTLCLL